MAEHGFAKLHVLCEYCQHFVRHARFLNMPLQTWIETRANIEDQVFEHAPNLSELKRMSHNGCHLCVMLWYSIIKTTSPECIASATDLGKPVTLKAWHDDLDTENEKYNINLSVQCENLDVIPGNDRRLWITAKAKISSEGRSAFPNARLSLSTGSPSVLALAKYWLMECEKDHLPCRATITQSTILPTRLIDVGTENHSLQLCTVKNRKECQLRYLTLSHCWGNLDVLKLKFDNISRLSNGFDIEELPQTFKDAVELTRYLGFRYLWIDALCIIQDSAVDWKKEASMMGSIYENSICTIGALFGSNSHAGCFKARQPLEHFSCKIQTDAGCAYVDSPYAHWELANETGWGPDQPGPLRTRAWVVQERMMSPRTLYFGSRHIHWQCRKYSSPYLDIETDFGSIGRGSREKVSFGIYRYPLAPLRTLSHRLTFYFTWDGFLGPYTEGRLTRPEDRLVALNGFVQLVQRCTNLTMKFGIWMELLPFEILWTKSLRRRYNQVTPPLQYKRAPSWSWASQDGPVSVADVAFAKDPIFFIKAITVEDTTNEEEATVLTTPNSLYIHLQGPLATLSDPVISNQDDVYTFHREEPSLHDPYYMVFDPSHFVADSQAFDWSCIYCLLVARASPMNPNLGQGTPRLQEFNTLKERWPQFCDNPDVDYLDPNVKSNHDSDDPNHKHAKKDEKHDANDDEVIEPNYDKAWANIDEFDENHICDYGLVLVKTGDNIFRRFGTFRAYHNLGQKLFVEPPPMASIYIE